MEMMVSTITISMRVKAADRRWRWGFWIFMAFYRINRIAGLTRF
jgi:hypothetical protein